MERRAFLALPVAALAGLDTAWARPAEKVRIGRLSPLTAETDRPFIGAFRTGLGQLGWVEGQDFTIVSRFAQGHPDRLSRLAGELVGQRVDVILTGSNPGALAAKTATSTIPIVMVTTGDPIGGGIVASLARPGGNVTGLTALGQVLSAKRLEVLREAVPGVTRVAVLVNPVSPYTRPFLQERERTARELGLELPLLEADTPDKLPGAFAALAGERAGALMVLTDLMFIAHRRTIVDLAARHRMPAVYGEREFVNAGGLLFYGASLVDMYRRAAFYVDRIVKGARPADLPVEQPTTFELAVNLVTARALRLTIPQSLLVRANRVIDR